MAIRDFIKKIYKEAYFAPIAISLFLVPLFWNPFFIYSFTQGKEILFKTIILLSFFILNIVFICKKKFNFRNIFRSSIFSLLLFQICIYVITNVLSSTPIVTLYGTYSRGFGFIIECFLFSFLIYCSLFLSENYIIKAFKIIFISGLIVAIYACFQKFGFNPFFKGYDINIFAGRAFSFSGNPSYLGQTMLIDVIIGVFLVFLENTRVKRIMYALGTSILLIVLFFSGTRAALIGIIFITILLIIKYFKFIINFFKKHLLLFLIAILSFVFIFMALPKDRYSFSDIAFRSLNSRFEIWNGAIDLIKKKPLLGYGEETFYIYFPEIITKKFLTLEEDININADRLHNETLEIFFAHGVIAVIIYLLLFIFIVRTFFKSKNKITIALSSLVIANFLQNQFAFSDITISVLIAFAFGGLVALDIKDFNNRPVEFKRWIQYLIFSVFLVLIFYIGFFTVYKANMSQLAYAESRKNYDINYSVAIDKHKEALSYTPYYSELWYELMFIDPTSMDKSLFMLEQIDGNSGNVLAWKGNLYADSDPKQASEFYIKALEKNKYHPNWIRAFADMLYEQGDYENALYLYNQYLESIPDFWKWANELDKHSLREKQSYETFLKHTPYFWDIIKKINHITSVLENNFK